VIIGPDGGILAQAGSERPELIMAEVLPEQIARARAAVPYLKDRRLDLYPSWASPAAGVR
jgi:predicted amidohydrolase